LLPELRRRFPAMVPHVIEDQTARLLDGLRNGLVDVALLALPTETTGLIEIPLYSEEFVLVTPAGHELAGRADLSPAALEAMPLLLLDEGHCLRDQSLDVCRAQEVRPGPAGDTRAASLATVVQCVAGGLGVTLIPQMAVAAETSRGTLEIARFAAPAPGRTLGLAFRSSTARTEDYERLADVIRAQRPV
jgi:LysR family transcriptional regulator, hydrogen peroxide-inducible genes activator